MTDIDAWDNVEASTPIILDNGSAMAAAETTPLIAADTPTQAQAEAPGKRPLRTIDCGQMRTVKENADGTWSVHNILRAHKVKPFDDWSEACQYVMRA